MYESLGLDEINPQVLAMVVVGLVLFGTILAVYFMSPKSGLGPGTGGTGTGPVTVTPGGTPVLTPPPVQPPVAAPGTAGAGAGGAGGAGGAAGAGTGATGGVVPVGVPEELAGLSTGAIVGIVVGIVALIVLVMGAFKTKNLRKEYEKQRQSEKKGFGKFLRSRAKTSLERAKTSLERAGRGLERTIRNPMAHKRAKITEKLFRRTENEDEFLLIALLYFQTHTLVDFYNMMYANEDVNEDVEEKIAKANKMEILLARERDAYLKISGVAKLRLLYIGSDGKINEMNQANPDEVRIILKTGATIVNATLITYQENQPRMFAQLFQKFKNLSLTQKKVVADTVGEIVPGSEDSKLVQGVKQGNLSLLSQWWGGISNWFRSRFSKKQGGPV
jgi:hypothetical protein